MFLYQPKCFRGIYLCHIYYVVCREFVLARQYIGFLLFGPAVEALLIVLALSLAMPAHARDEILEFVLPGILLSASIRRCFETNAHSIMEGKLNREIENLLGAPLSSFEIITGWILFAKLNAIVAMAMIWALLSPFEVLVPSQFFICLIWLLLGCIICSGIGILAAFYLQTWDSLSTKETFVFMPALLLSGVFFPINVLPDFWIKIMQWNPLYQCIKGFRSAIRDVDFDWHGLAVAVIFASLIMTLCFFKIKSKLYH